MAFEELQQRLAAMWGAGRFERIAPALDGMPEIVIDAVDIREAGQTRRPEGPANEGLLQ